MEEEEEKNKLKEIKISRDKWRGGVLDKKERSCNKMIATRHWIRREGMEGKTRGEEEVVKSPMMKRKAVKRAF